MSRVCGICGKSKAAGNNVTFSHRGIRRTWTPNLRRVRVYDENGTPKRMYVCSRCLRSGLANRNRTTESVQTVEEANTEAVIVEETQEAVTESAEAEN